MLVCRREINNEVLTMSYALLKNIHISAVVVSYLLFLLRGIWILRNTTARRPSWVRVVPHIIDTLLLASAIALAVIVHQYPLQDAWLTAKVSGLLLYIALGMVAMRFGKTRGVRLTAWIAAQCVFFYIVLVAVSKQPLLGLL